MTKDIVKSLTPSVKAGRHGDGGGLFHSSFLNIICLLYKHYNLFSSCFLFKSRYYDAEGNLERTELPNGVVEIRTYDELNRLKLLAYQRNEVTLQSFDYTLYPVGHRKVVTEQNGRKVEYEYDDLYRLIKETITDSVRGNRTISYGYDAVGNRLTKTDSVAGMTSYSIYQKDEVG